MDATGAGRSTYVFDASGQLLSLRNGNNERTTFSYDDAGRRIVQRNANGTRVSMSYDAAGQMTQVFHRKSDGTSLLKLNYGYDPGGNRKSMSENDTAARTTWTYDKQNQLLGEHRTGTNPYRQTFTYDAAGNRTLKNVDAVRTTYAYDSANQLRYGQAVAGRTTFVYDATGNQRIEQPPAGNRTTTTWNFENQPTQYLLPSGSRVTMAYNGDNRRVQIQEP
jgi:YD repeat-containing protein